MHGGSGSDTLAGGDLFGGVGVDAFRFRTFWNYNSATLITSTSTILDYENGENISLAGARVITGTGDDPYDYRYTTRPLERSDISLARSGSDLTLTGPTYAGTGGYTNGPLVCGVLTIAGFFSRGLTSVTIDGVATDVSGL
jgi:hypothetical protein